MDTNYKRLTLQLDVPTRWNSCYRMVNNSIVLKKYLEEYIRISLPYKQEVNTIFGKIVVEPLSDEDWKELEFIKKFLYLFNLFTDCFQTGKYPTLGYIIF